MSKAKIEAEDDARLFGIGFIKILPDGTQERIDPRTIYISEPQGTGFQAGEAEPAATKVRS